MAPVLGGGVDESSCFHRCELAIAAIEHSFKGIAGDHGHTDLVSWL